MKWFSERWLTNCLQKKELWNMVWKRKTLFMINLTFHVWFTTKILLFEKLISDDSGNMIINRKRPEWSQWSVRDKWGWGKTKPEYVFSVRDKWEWGETNPEYVFSVRDKWGWGETNSDNKVLLPECKRHTACRVASTCYAVPMGGTYPGGGYLPGLDGGYLPSEVGGTYPGGGTYPR